MARRAETRKRANQASRPVVDRLSPAEAQTILGRFLSAHGDLRDEAEQLARGLLAEVSFEAVASAVDYPGEAAQPVLTTGDRGLRGSKRRPEAGRKGRPAFPDDFVAEHLPEWAGLVERVLKDA